MTKLPVLAAATAVVFLGFAVVLVLFSETGREPSTITIVGLIVSTIPSLIAAAFSERASRDIRNGVVKGKVKEAIAETLPSTVIADDEETKSRKDNDNG